MDNLLAFLVLAQDGETNGWGGLCCAIPMMLLGAYEIGYENGRKKGPRTGTGPGGPLVGLRKFEDRTLDDRPEP